MNLFPAIDLYGGNAVRLYKGNYDEMTVYDTDPVAVAERMKASGAVFAFGRFGGCAHGQNAESRRDSFHCRENRAVYRGRRRYPYAGDCGGLSFRRCVACDSRDGGGHRRSIPPFDGGDLWGTYRGRRRYQGWLCRHPRLDGALRDSICAVL